MEHGKERKDEFQGMGIRSDRYLTPMEVQRAAENYKAVKRAAESDISPGIIEWILMGLVWLVILYATVCALFG